MGSVARTSGGGSFDAVRPRRGVPPSGLSSGIGVPSAAGFPTRRGGIPSRLPYLADSTEGRLLAGDREALGEVIRWIADTIAQPRYWSIRSDWNDLAHESLVRVVESLRDERFDSSREFRAYVQGIARYATLNALRVAIRRGRELARNMAPSHPSRESVESAMTDRQLVRQVLDMASEDCRRLFRAYFYEGLTYTEIAASDSAPIGTVKSRLFRCLQAASTVFARARRRPAVVPKAGG